MNYNHENGRPLIGHRAAAYCLLIAGLVGTILLLSCNREWEPGTAADLLIEALVKADAEQARSVTIPDQWDRIDDWIAGRKPFKCRGSGLMDLTGISGSVKFDTAAKQWMGSLSYQCASERTPYCLDRNDIVVRQTEDGWRVADWGSVCEAADFSYRCAELCQ